MVEMVKSKSVHFNVLVCDWRKIKKFKRKYYRVVAFEEETIYNITKMRNGNVIYSISMDVSRYYQYGFFVIKKYENINKINDDTNEILKNLLFDDCYFVFKTKSAYMKWKLKS